MVKKFLISVLKFVRGKDCINLLELFCASRTALLSLLLRSHIMGREWERVPRAILNVPETVYRLIHPRNML